MEELISKKPSELSEDDRRRRLNELKYRYARKNKEKVKESKEKYRANNKEKERLAGIEYREKNKEILAIKKREYYINNRDKVNKHDREYRKNRRDNDPLYKLKVAIRSRTTKAFKRASWRKTGTSELYLGCNYATAKTHIEKQFSDGMSWDNYGEWHVDHIIPLFKATNPDELISLCHYTNLQPLWAIDNIKKGHKFN